MLGDQISETAGKRTGRRALPSEGSLKVEVSFEETGKLLGMDIVGFGTYTAGPRADGSLYGEGQGAITTKEGDMATWKGAAVGRFVGGGAVSYRGAIYYQTASPKLAKLNTLAAVFEFDSAADGSTHTKMWEWK